MKSIFNVIAGAEQISRAEIAGITGLSLVTAGKIADALLDAGILKQQKEIKATAGRRAGILALNTDKFAFVLDLSKKNFCFSVLNLGLVPIETITHTYKNDRLYEDNLHDFLTEIMEHSYENYAFDDCFGFGVSLPGIYNPESDSVNGTYIPELKNIRLCEVIGEYFPMLSVYPESGVNLSALSNVSVIPDYARKNILYWFIGADSTDGTFMIRGDFLDGTPGHPCDFGNMVLPAGNTVRSALQRCKSPSEYAAVLSGPVHNCIQILAPHVIILEFEELADGCSSVSPELCRILHEKYHHRYDHLPDILGMHYENRQSHRGLVMRLRSQWLERIIFDKNNV
ncbi:MAG: hypothetical protein IJ325_03120 [Clostridia bacterium]|nr:hypothetical protein [Clostridia bacterium]